MKKKCYITEIQFIKINGFLSEVITVKIYDISQDAVKHKLIDLFGCAVRILSCCVNLE